VGEQRGTRALSSPWGAPDVVAGFDTRGFSDAGEEVALAAVAPWARGAVLDVGVGGGRTTGLLVAGAASYVGVDISEEMVAAAARRHPGARLLVGDARHLDGLPDAHFDLVVFSFNGLDSLSRPDRPLGLAAMRRVVAPAGRVLFSALNLDGVSYDEHPLHVAGGLTSPRVRWHWTHALRHPSSLARSVRNHRRVRPTGTEGPGWGMRAMRAHEFRFLVHFSTLGRMVADARAAGLEVLEGYADDGSPVDVTQQHCDADYVHLVCAPR
jgi:SAM-dependent methyltransferase